MAAAVAHSKSKSVPPNSRSANIPRSPSSAKLYITLSDMGLIKTAKYLCRIDVSRSQLSPSARQTSQCFRAYAILLRLSPMLNLCEYSERKTNLKLTRNKVQEAQ